MSGTYNMSGVYYMSSVYNMSDVYFVSDYRKCLVHIVCLVIKGVWCIFGNFAKCSSCLAMLCGVVSQYCWTDPLLQGV